MKKYLTTTLPYINAEPHVGFAFELIQADILARHFRLCGNEVILNTGTDEHGTKIWENNKENTQEFCNIQSEKFKSLLKILCIGECNFIRTTDAFHKEAVKEFWNRCKNDIYKANYKIKYCNGCELEKQDSELKDGKCQYHPNLNIEERIEENYYFKLSKYQKALEKHFSENEFILPRSRQIEAINFIKSGLKDISISRLKTKMPWGIGVPNDPEHVVYVWFDALVNYISALGWPNKDISDYWPGYQFAGKDNLRQQSIIWTGMLLSAGIPLPKQIFIHGFLTQNGSKISKSNLSSISPQEILKIFPISYLRYWFARECSEFEDTDIDIKSFYQNYNDSLSKGLGNVFSRILKMAITNNVTIEYNNSYSSYQLDSFNIRGGIDVIWNEIKILNTYIQTTEPFRNVKISDNKNKAIEDIKFLLTRLHWIAIHLQPYMPDTASLMIDHLSSYEMIQLFPQVTPSLV